MKKYRNITLSLICLISFLPINIFAQDVNLGLDIEGEIIISAITTINTNIKLDLASKETTTSYVKTSNTGNSNLDVSIIDITAVGVDSPSMFVNYDTNEPTTGKSWTQLNEAETKQFIAFGISKNAISYTSILPDTTIKLGTVKAHPTESMGAGVFDNDEEFFNLNPSRSFAIRAKTGFIWGTVNNLSYTITTLVELSPGLDVINPSKHTGLNDVTLGTSSSAFNSNLTLAAIYNTTYAFTMLPIEDVVFSGKIISPTGVETLFFRMPNIAGYNQTDTGEGYQYSVWTTLSNFTFTEYGTYYIEFGFGFMDGTSFVPEDNYGQVISVTIQ